MMIDDHSDRLERALAEVNQEIAKEAAMISLCARGARYSTIDALFGGVMLSRVRELNRRFHGPEYKGAKPVGIKYYIETSERRAKSTTCIINNIRLEKSQLGQVELFIRLHESHAHVYQKSAYDIDDLIRLVRAYQNGDFRLENCACGCKVLLAKHEIHATEHCPRCNPERDTKRKRRTVERPELPSAETINEVIVEYTSAKRMAVNLVLAAARPKEVEVLVPGQEKFARYLWRKLLDKSPPQGWVVFNKNYYVETIERRRQTSFLVKMQTRIERAGLKGPELLLAVYASYLKVFSTASSSDLMSYSRVRFCLQLVKAGELMMHSCKDCRTAYVVMRDEIPGDQPCPMCRMIAGRVKPAVAVHECEVGDTGLLLPPMPGDAKRRREERRQKGPF